VTDPDQPGWRPADQRGADYDQRWRALEAAGASLHGEADFVCRFEPASVLDAGCGTGRVAIELARRGIDVVGVDVDQVMIDHAREKAPQLRWGVADLSTFDGSTVGIEPASLDLVVMAGNVMIFIAPGTEAAVLARAATVLRPGGRIITGFSIKPGGYGPFQLDRDAEAAGLELEHRYGTWEGDAYGAGDDYAVSVFRAT
jgi:SAM-dependent methyltransferase